MKINRKLFPVILLMTSFLVVMTGLQAKDSKAVLPGVKQVQVYQTPCLTVSTARDGNGNEVHHGFCFHLPMMFVKTNEDKPVRVAIINNTPGGSGDTIRNSVWFALATAANMRKNTLHGTLLTVEFSGLIDGPSAGGVMCLTILAAIDGRQLPDDYAMTGTILPDGTIGIVGGLEAKITAAAKEGKTRIFVPSYYSSDVKKSSETKDQLYKLAEKLSRKTGKNIKLYFVNDIHEVYNKLFDIEVGKKETYDYKVFGKLSPRNVAHLQKMYNKYRIKAEQMIAKDNKLKKNTHYQTACKLYQADQYLAAALQMFYAYSDMNAAESYKAELQLLLQKIRKKMTGNESETQKLRLIIKALNEQNALYLELMSRYFSENSKTLKGLQTQGLMTSEMLSTLTGLYEQIVANNGDSVDKITDKDKLNSILQEKERLYETLIACLGAIVNNQKDDLQMLQMLDSLNPVAVNPDTAQDLNLFYDQAIITIYNAIIRDLKEKRHMVLEKMTDPNTPFLKARQILSNIASNANHVDILRYFSKSALDDGENGKRGIYMQLGIYVQLSLEYIWTSEFKNPDLYVAMMLNAQKMAAESIMECRKNGITCLPALYEYEMATYELAEFIKNADDEDSEEDYAHFAKMIIAGFWKSAYFAKATSMLTQEGGVTPEPDTGISYTPGKKQQQKPGDESIEEQIKQIRQISPDALFNSFVTELRKRLGEEKVTVDLSNRTIYITQESEYAIGNITQAQAKESFIKALADSDAARRIVKALLEHAKAKLIITLIGSDGKRIRFSVSASDL